MRHLSPVATLFVTVLLAATTAISADATARTCGGKKLTIIGTRLSDVIRGTRGPDVIDGLGGNDVINGLGGNDVICGGYGSDDLRGHGGADRLYGGPDGFVGRPVVHRDGDRLRGGPGNDTLVPGLDNRPAPWAISDQLLYDTSPRGVIVNLPTGSATGDGTDRLVVNGNVGVTTGRFSDRVTGSRFEDSIRTGAGNDSVSAGAGNDHISLGDGGTSERDIDTAIGGPGNDSISSAGGKDSLAGGGGDDVLRKTSDGRGTLTGGPGSDYLIAEATGFTAADRPATAEHLDGGAGADLVSVITPQFDEPSATLDIPSQVFNLGIPTRLVLKLNAFEAYAFVRGALWRVTGSSGADFVDGRLTNVLEMTGLGGDDTLRGGGWLGASFDGGADQDCFESPFGTATLTDVETETDSSSPCPWPDVPTAVAY